MEFQHEKDPTVFQIIFVTNSGTLLTACTDNTVYLWDFKRKKPEIVSSLKLSKERLTVICCEFQDKWLYIGKKHDCCAISRNFCLKNILLIL